MKTMPHFHAAAMSEGRLDRRALLSLSLAVPLLTTTMVPDAAPAAPAPAAFDRLLAKHVRVGRDGVARVDYAGWKADRADMTALDAIVADLAGAAVSRMARPAQFAHWANLYNAVTLQVVLARFPVRSIRDIKPHPLALGPWKEPRVTVEGRRLSLDDIEHEILRKRWSDPRVHYAVNCASIGCPNLRPRAWRADTLDADLDAAAAAFVNHPRGVSVDARGRATVSSIYQWFKADFGGNDAGVLAHLRAHAAPDLAARLRDARIVGHRYDWSINSIGAGGA
jgi:hypothetical protein